MTQPNWAEFAEHLNHRQGPSTVFLELSSAVYVPRWLAALCAKLQGAPIVPHRKARGVRGRKRALVTAWHPRGSMRVYGMPMQVLDRLPPTPSGPDLGIV